MIRKSKRFALELSQDKSKSLGLQQDPTSPSYPGCSLEGLMLKLKLQYFGHLMQRADSPEKTVMVERLRAGGEQDDRG